MSQQATIRHATRADVPVILGLVKELAVYEHALDKVLATEETLNQTLSFDEDGEALDHGTPRGYAKTLLLTASDGVVAGMALYFFNYSTWRAAPGIYLEDLFVKKEYRGRGYGKQLIFALAKEVKRVNGGRLEWSCLRWNEPSLKFYESIGANQMSEWVGLRVDGDALDALAQK